MTITLTISENLSFEKNIQMERPLEVPSSFLEACDVLLGEILSAILTFNPITSIKLLVRLWY